MSFGETFNIGGTVASDPPSSSLITPSVAVSRTSGVAPLAILFDASATTAASYTSRPFHDLEYRYDFGDETVSTWTYGAQPGVLLKNVAYDSTAAHVYESSGTYSPTVTIRYRLGDGSYDSTTYSLPSVTVTAANTQWATTKTVCYSTNSDFTDAPSGCVQVTSSDADAALAANIGNGKRILFCRGETFAVSTSMLVRNDDVYIGAYGSGAKPYFTVGGNIAGISLGGGSSTTYNRLVTMDLAFDATGYVSDSQGFGATGGFDDWLCLRCEVSHSKFGWKIDSGALSGYNSGINPVTDPPIVHLYRGHGVVDCYFNESVGNDNGANCFYMGGEAMAIMGNNLDPNFLGEHGIRCPIIQKGVISHNKVQRIDDGRAYITLRSPDQGSLTYPEFVYGPYVYSEYAYVNDNDADGGTTQPVTAVGIGPVNQSATGRARYMLFERNYLRGIETNIAMQGTNGHCRLNLFRNQQLSTFFVEDLQGGPKPTDQHWYHNSVYSSGTTTNTNLWSPNDGGMTSAETAYIRNNAIYQPGRAGHTVVGTTANMTTVSSNNTNSTQVESNNPFAATTPPTTALHWKPAGGSYAIDAGIDLAVWSDFLNVAMYSAGTRDMGAIQS